MTEEKTITTEQLEKQLDAFAVDLDHLIKIDRADGRDTTQAESDAALMRAAVKVLAQSIAEVEQLREALTKAANQFEFYAMEHRQKVKNQMFNGLPVLAEAAARKAETNEQFAAMCRTALEEPKPTSEKPTTP